MVPVSGLTDCVVFTNYCQNIRLLENRGDTVSHKRKHAMIVDEGDAACADAKALGYFGFAVSPLQSSLSNRAHRSVSSVETSQGTSFMPVESGARLSMTRKRKFQPEESGSDRPNGVISQSEERPSKTSKLCGSTG